jgi:thioredoxin reductase (NADPH)
MLKFIFYKVIFMQENIYDLVIVGGGPAGLSAAIYAGRYKMNTVVISGSLGGTITLAHMVCNYPGFIEISGMELMNKITEQVEALNVPIYYEKVMKIDKIEENIFIVNTDTRTFKAHKVLLALGNTRRELGLDKEKELIGKGISYCATCDGGFFKNKVVGVVGGSDAAVTSALVLADVASKVYLIYRRDKLRAEPSWADLALKNQKIEILYNTEVTELLGEAKLTGVKFQTGDFKELDGLFIEIGSVPNTEMLKNLNVDVDKYGFIKVDRDQRTNVFGLLAAGDITDSTEFKQVITAEAQGSIAAFQAYKELKKE